MKRCFFCYKEIIEAEENILHAKCSRRFFGPPDPPLLPYSLDEIEMLAREIINKSVAVPGVQAKMSLKLHIEKNAASRLTLVGLMGDYILKPPTKEYPYMPELEDLTMRMAEIFRIQTVPHCLIRHKSEEIAYITRRIDREKPFSATFSRGFDTNITRRDGGKLSGKIHMEDMCQLNERLTEDRYQGSMESVGKCIRKYSSNPGFDLVSFYEIVLLHSLGLIPRRLRRS